MAIIYNKKKKTIIDFFLLADVNGRGVEPSMQISSDI